MKISAIGLVTCFALISTASSAQTGAPAGGTGGFGATRQERPAELAATRLVRCQAKECAAQMLRQPPQAPQLVQLQRRLQTQTEPQDKKSPAMSGAFFTHVSV